MYNITFRGEDCTEYGVIPERRPSVPAPEIRVTETEIPGMDGTLIENDGTYAPITIPVEFNFLGPQDEWMETYRKAKRWLSGSGWLILSDDPDYWYKVYYCNISDTERTTRRLGRFTAEFVCYPYTFLADGQNQYDISGAKDNPYMISHPTYIITGTGECTLTVNGNTMTANVNQGITIDTDRMIAYNSSMVNQSSLVSGNYEDLYLIEGENNISITTGFTLKIIPNWRTL